MQRDYLLRIIDQVGQLLARMIRQRRGNTPQEALQSLMAACERLFGMEAVQLFQFTPDQHYAMLTENEDAQGAREKVLMYAALNAEAGQCYVALSQPKLAQQSFINALRLTLKVQAQFPSDSRPEFAPNESELLTLIGDAPLDSETTALLASRDVSPRLPPR